MNVLKKVAVPALLVILIAAIVALTVTVVKLNNKIDSQTVAAPTDNASAVTTTDDTAAQTTSTDTSDKTPASTEASDETASGVTALKCSMSKGAMNITYGSEFSVRDAKGSDVSGKIVGDTYVVEGSKVSENAVTVTVPSGLVLSSLTLEVSGGALESSGLVCDQLYTNCTAGALHFNGTVNGDCDFQQSAGKTIINLNGSETDFNYVITYSMGHINYAGHQYLGLNGSDTGDNGAAKNITANCSMGSMTILFS